MTFTDWLIDLLLIATVARQVRPQRLTAGHLLLPVAIVGYVAAKYLSGVPTGGNDLVLVGATVGLGLALGAGSGLATRVTTGADGVGVARAGVVAVSMWMVGMGARLVFQLYATHGGAPAIGRFMQAHDLTSGTVWAAAIILMAIAEVLARTGVLAWRAYGADAHLTARRPAPMA